jgi:hypothetical protein
MGRYYTLIVSPTDVVTISLNVIVTEVQVEPPPPVEAV